MTNAEQLDVPTVLTFHADVPSLQLFPRLNTDCFDYFLNPDTADLLRDTFVFCL
jgi:hypothetical protein